jgi:hypothetical protein
VFECFMAVGNFGATFPGVLTRGPSGSVLLYPGDGKGALQSPQSFPIRGLAGPMTAADFNGDQTQDAALIDSGAGNGGITILLGR